MEQLNVHEHEHEHEHEHVYEHDRQECRSISYDASRTRPAQGSTQETPMA